MFERLGSPDPVLVDVQFMPERTLSAIAIALPAIELSVERTLVQLSYPIPPLYVQSAVETTILSPSLLDS